MHVKNGAGLVTEGRGIKYEKFLEIADTIVLVALVVWSLFTLWRASSFPGRPFGGDYGLNLEQTLQVIDLHTFPYGFVYPLPCILLRYFLFKAAGNYGGVIWVFSIALAFAFSVRFLLAELYTGDGRVTYLYFLLAFLPVAYYIQLDMTMLNCNLIVLSLVLLSMLCLKKEGWFLSGLFLSLGIALKLYPIVIVPYLLFRKKFRAAIFTLLWSAVFFVLIPVIALGSFCFIELTGKWLQAVSSIGAPDFLVNLQAHKISMHYAILSLLAHGDPIHLSARGMYEAKRITFWLKLLVAGSGLIYLVFDLRKPCLKVESYHILFSTVLVLSASLLFSDLLQPHHGVVLLGCSMIMVNAALNGSLPKFVRCLLLGVVFLPFVALRIASPGVQKVLAMNFHIVIYVLSLVFLRFYPKGCSQAQSLASSTL
ncbi:MAG: glycosyltransferase family 87 protein [Syntrophobacteraceae bacterium]|nr:glycosyltransferase family 87 protein [Syntrophobacteraceae bacterium]